MTNARNETDNWNYDISCLY